MTYRLSSSSLAHATKHLCKYGDTDVFPHLASPSSGFQRSTTAPHRQNTAPKSQPPNPGREIFRRSETDFRLFFQPPVIGRNAPVPALSLGCRGA
jgi:hypothetical protein